MGKERPPASVESSAKADDVDVVFRLVQLDSRTLKLTCTHSRARMGALRDPTRAARASYCATCVAKTPCPSGPMTP